MASAVKESAKTVSVVIQSAARVVPTASVRGVLVVRARVAAAIRVVRNLLVGKAVDLPPAESRAFDFSGGVDNDPVNSR
ncbi:MAG: hypothetical protein HOK57_00480 [Planctomycetaceae bacterium]|jgi:hypothetical protein|nr:hypothetical protein [Planctomycetaceae bacterium]